MEKITTQVLGLCTPWKSVTPSHDRHKLVLQSTPLEILDIINLDYLSPFSNGHYVFVMIDQRTKYPEVELMPSTCIKNGFLFFFALERFFSMYISNKIILNNGLPFAFYELQEYFATKGIKHHTTRPFWSQAKGQVEGLYSILE